MVTQQDTVFTKFAGQLVAGGLRTNQPTVALEATVDKTVYSNLNNIGGLMPKVADILIHDTKVFNNPLDPYIRKIDSPYGVGLEEALFLDGAANKKSDGTCVPRGTATAASQLSLINWAYNINVDVKDREVNKSVLTPDQAGMYVAQKLRTPLKTLAQSKYRSWVQLLSDVTSGTRSITGYTDSGDSSSTSVTYNPTVAGYAGMVNPEAFTVAPVEAGSLVTFAAPADALTVVQDFEGAAADMGFEGTSYNKLGANTFVSGKPLLVMETKVLNAMDVLFSDNANYKGFPTVSARQRMGQFADIVEIDSFAALPTNATYDAYRLGGVLIDRDALTEVTKYGDVEAQRCVQERLTGYNYQGESIFTIFKGAPSYAMLFDKQA